MTIWILAILVIGLLALVGFFLGAIRSAVVLLGVLLGGVLAVPLGPSLRPLFTTCGVTNTVWLWIWPPVAVFGLVFLIFFGLSFAAHYPVAKHYKFTTDAVGVHRWQPDEQAALKPTLTTKSGKKRTIDEDLLDWQWLGVDGSSKGSLHAGGKNGSGWLIGTYDQFSAMVPVQIGVVSKPLLNFESNPELSFTGLPQATGGSFTLSKESQKDGSFSGKLAYDFSKTTGDTEIAYGEFGAAGIPFPGPAGGISLWVKGDGSGHWLRAEVKDSAGKIQYLTLAPKVDWTGWQQVSADFSGEMDAPVLKRIYLVNQGLAGGSNLSGSILIDQIAYKTWQTASAKNNVTLKLVVNKKTMVVDGIASTIDQGPLVENGRSYIPARSIVEALGGKVIWNGGTKMVRVISGAKMIDLWIDDQLHTIVNGVNSPQDAAPIIRNGRTLVPVRLVTESLGYKVEWNQGQITVH